MGIIRQMPGLYLRGSIANITMATLNETQKTHIEGVFREVVNHPELVKHKNRVIKEFGATIRADYADDRSIAEQEFNIAVWRGLVDIYYHHSYSFQCKSCNATSSLTKRGKPKPIDRLVTPCPVCRMAEIVEPGCSEWRTGEYVNHDEAQERFKNTPSNTPTFKSCIKAIKHERKHQNPDDIINNPIQLKRFFGEFIWNYFRQQIKENKRKEKNKKPIKISGPADEMVNELILSLCSRLNINYNQHKKNQSCDKYVINVLTIQTPPEFSIELAVIRELAVNNNVTMLIADTVIEIIPGINPPHISISVVKPEHVTLIDAQSPTNGEDSGFSVEQVSHKTIGAIAMNQDDHIANTDLVDASSRTREALPEGDCRTVYDIYSQVGDIYDRFSERFGDTEPKINHIATFLGITTRTVKQHRETIAMQCLAHDFVPVG